MATITRQAYSDLYGPTTGDRLRLADTELIIEIEKDHTVYGEEVTFGGGKVIRDGMGQGQRLADEVADLIITNVIILDHWGIVKTDVGIKDGRISGIGKAGNPDIQPGVTIVVGPGTDVIAGEGKILTAGAIDTHIHFIAPQQAEEALSSGTDNARGRRHGPDRRHARNHGDTRSMGDSSHAGSNRSAADQRQGCLERATPAFPNRCASRSVRALSASSCMRIGARHQPPSTTALLLRTARHTGCDTHRYAERKRICAGQLRGDEGAGNS